MNHIHNVNSSIRAALCSNTQHKSLRFECWISVRTKWLALNVLGKRRHTRLVDRSEGKIRTEHQCKLLKSRTSGGKESRELFFPCSAEFQPIVSYSTETSMFEEKNLKKLNTVLARFSRFHQIKPYLFWIWPCVPQGCLFNSRHIESGHNLVSCLTSSIKITIMPVHLWVHIYQPQTVDVLWAWTWKNV